MTRTTGTIQPTGQPSYANMLATEIWLNCFRFCHEKQLRKLSRVCRYFRDLTQPLLFRNQSTYAPYPAMLERSNWIKSTQKLHRTTKRLLRLAAGVHAASVRSWSFSGGSGSLVLPPAITNIQILWDKWLQVLHTFKTTLGAYQRLIRLHLIDMTIDETFRETMASLPFLEHVTLDTCEILHEGPLLQLRTLTVHGPYGPRAGNADRALHIVAPHTLRHLALDSSPQSTAVLRALAADPLPHLTHLKLSLVDANIDLVFSCLNAAPRLESIDVHDGTSEGIPHRLLPTSIPALRSFTGSHGLAGLFVSGRPVADVELQPHRFDMTTDKIIAALHAISGASVPLRCLDIGADIPHSDMNAVFGAIGALFPDLRKLTTRLLDPPHTSFAWSDQIDVSDDEDADEAVDAVDERTVELSDDGTIDCASSESSFDSEYSSDNESADTPEPMLPGYMYEPSAPPTPPPTSDPAPATDADTAVKILMRAIAADEVALPAHLEELVFMQESFVWSGPLPFPLADQQRALLALERRLPALRIVTFAADRDEWVRDRDVWARDYADYFDYGWMRRKTVKVVSLVWNSDGTRVGV
ncbi:hypothetical protein C8R44DRAFT_978167 [Mycena epipterygia]|nr:hypothetical protein C8R44DRAFT_978167 [Mycena epipterygia]